MEYIIENKYLNNLFAVIVITIAASLDAFVINAFISNANLISTGFTGLALLLNSLSDSLPFTIDVSMMIIMLNIPVIILCYKAISPRFTILSTYYIIIQCIMIEVIKIEPFITDKILLVVFAGVLQGFAHAMSLKVDASTGGFDFIALYFSNKFNKTVWNYVLLFNVCIILIFGLTSGWTNAGYTIIYVFIQTRVKEALHTRYKRVTLQIITQKDKEIIDKFISLSKHGLTCSDCYGGYSNQKYKMITTVISSYEMHKIIKEIKDIDKNVIINIMDTVDFIGKFVQKAY